MLHVLSASCSAYSKNFIAYGILRFSLLQMGDYYPTPQKTMLRLFDLKFGTPNYWHKTIKNAKFQKVGGSTFQDMTS